MDVNLLAGEQPWRLAACVVRPLEPASGRAPNGVASPLDAARLFRARVAWTSGRRLAFGRPYLLEYGTERVRAAIGPDVLHGSEEDLGSLEVETHRPLSFEACEAERGAFLMIDPVGGEVLAAGLALEARADWADRTAVTSGDGQRGFTIWFTGLSSAGKSTLAQAVYERLRAGRRRVELLDGDAVRRGLCRDLGFRKEDRDENIRRIAFAAEVLIRGGAIVVVSVISPYRAIRDEARRNIGDFIEVYVNAPLEICERRDVKGLYRRARAGELRGFTGIDDPYEPPLTPEVECHTDRETPAESAGKVMRYLDAHPRYATLRQSP